MDEVLSQERLEKDNEMGGNIPVGKFSFWIFAAPITFLQLNMVFIADSGIGFCSVLLWKYELSLRSSNWSCSIKKVFLENLQI